MLTIGVGQMWGTDEVFYTLEPYATGSDATSTGYANAATATVDGISWKVTGNSNTVPWRIGGKGGSNSSSTSDYTRTVYSTTAIEENVTKIDITHGTSTLNALTTMTVTVSTAQNGGGTVRHTFTLNSSSTPKFEASKTITLERPNAEDWSNCYYLISYTVRAKGSSTQYLQFSQLDLYAAPAVAYTVTLKDDNSTLPEQSAGAGVTLPTRTGCTGYTFVGWTSSWTSNQTEWTQIAPTIIPSGSYSPTANVDLYPVYRKGTGTASATITTTLTEGKQYVFGAVKAAPSTSLANNTAIGAIGFTSVYSSTSWGQYTTYTPNTNGVITASINSAYIWYLESVSSGKYSFKNSNNASYPYIYLSTSTGQNQAGLNTSGQVYIEDVSSTCKDAFKLHPSSNGTNKLLLNTSSNYGYRMYGSSQSESASMCPYIRFYEYNVDYYYISVPNCCTSLGSINGSVSVTNSGTSITVKDWTYTKGDAAEESNISTYDVYLYSDADSYAQPVQTQTCAYNAKGTGVTFTGLSYARTYKFKIGATAATNYCDITPVQVTTINSTSTQTFQLDCVDPGLAYGTSPVVKTFGNGKFTNELTNSHGVSVSYSSNNTDVATVDANGEVTIKQAGSATITASSGIGIVSDVKYCADEASYALTVNKADISPSLLYASTSLTVDGTSAAPTISGNAGNGTVSYAVTAANPTGCATVNETTGVVTAVAAGSATITATIGATTNYNGNTATANFTISAASQCAAPTFSVNTGTYVGSQNVTISSTSGATIYYTTDGSDPTSSGTRSTYSSAIPVGVTTTIRAYAEKSGMSDSEEGSATITIKCAAPTFDPVEDTYTSAQNVTLATTYGDEIYYTTNGDDPATNGTKYTGPIAVNTTGTTIKAIAKKTNCANSDLATATYTIKCETPTITPGTGDVTTGQEITLSCETAGATIYYTMGANPADPTTASTPYDPENKPVVTAATTIKAIAVKDGWSNSTVASATYAMKYTVTLNAGTGNVSDAGWTASAGVWTKAQTSAGSPITLPDATIGVTGWSFSGWKTGSAVTTETNDKPSYVNKTYTPTSNITLYAVYEKTSGGTAVDKLDRAFTTVTSTSYTEWSNKGGSASNAVYAGKTTTNSNQDYLQMKGGDNVGIISTNSGGKAKKVTVTWHSNQTSTGDNYVLQVYGKNEAYSATSDLYSAQSATQGTSLGTIAATSETELTITGDYEYIGLRGSKNALYFAEIDIEWSTASTKYYSNPSSTVTLTYDGNGQTSEASTVPALSNYTIGNTATVVAKPEGLVKTGYTFGGWNTKDDGTGDNYVYGTEQQSFTINDNTTLYAKWTINKHTVSVSAVADGNITATPASASAIAEGANNAAVAYGTVVTLAQTADMHYTFGDWTVTKDGDAGTVVPVSEGTFTMPDFDVVVSANFTEDAKRNVKFYSNGTQLGTTQEVYVGEAPVAETAVYENCLEGSNQFYGWATEEWTGAIDASTLAGKTVETGDMPNVAEGTEPIEYYAVWAKGTESTSTYVLGTSANLTNGKKVIIVNRDAGKALENDGTWDGANAGISEGKITSPASTILWTVETATGGVKFKVSTNYLAGSSSSPFIALNTTGSIWTIGQSSAPYTLTSGSRYFEYYNNAFTTYYNSGTSNPYLMDFYVPEVTYSDFRTNCCGLKPATNVQVGTIGETSVELTWTAPTSVEGITKLQVVNADNGNVLKDDISASETSATVTGLTKCVTYNLKVVSVGDDCSSNSAVVSATPQEEAKTVTFKYNDDVTADVVESTTCSADNVAVPANPTRDGYRFMGWKNGEELIEGETFTPSAASTTINATWAQLYTVHYDYDGASGAPEDAQYIAGEEVTLTDVEPNKGVLAPFKAWAFSPSVEVSEGKFAMPAEDVTITATYDEIVGQWILVTDENTLSANDMIVIGSGANGVVAGEISSQVMASVSALFTTDKTVLTAVPNDAVVLKLGGTSSAWTLNRLSDNKKLGATAEKKLAWDGASATETWTISIEDNDATILNGTSSYGNLQYNSGSPRFTTYTSSQTLPQIYRFREGMFYNINMPAEVPTGGSVVANTTMAKAGDVVTLTYTPSRGYTVESLTVTGATSGEITISPAVEAGITEYTFTMPAEAVTVAASFEAVPPVEYTLVEDASDLAVGMQFLMVGKKASPLTYYGANEISGSFLSATELEDVIDAVNNKASITTQEVIDFVLEGEPGKYKILYEGKELKDGGNTNISFVESGSEWTITNVENSEAVVIQANNKFQFNPNSPRFTTYSNGGQQPIYIYALPYTTYNFTLSGCKTIKVANGYTYTYTIKNTDVPSVTPEGYEFLYKWTDGTNTYAVEDEVVVSTAKTLEPCWKVTPTANVDINDLPATVTEIVVKNEKTLTVDENRTLDNLIVEAGGKVTGSATLNVQDLTIKTSLGTISGNNNTGGKSGEILNPDNITANGDVWIEIELTQDAAASYGWYAFSVPFPVDALNGVYYGSTKLQNEVGYAIMSHNGELRAQNEYAWKKYRGIMQPGVFYVITVGNTDYKTLRFKKVAGKAIFNEGNVVNEDNQMATKEYASEIGDNHAGWNGLGNPYLETTKVGCTYLQFYDHGDNVFRQRTGSAVQLMVGSAFFYQSDGSAITFTKDKNGSIALAPARTLKAIENTIFEVRLNDENGREADNLFLTAREEAKNEYEIGRDVAKMSMGTAKCAQMWVPAYGTQLCAADFPLVNDKATYPLTINAPSAGTYTISTVAQDEADIYLTQDGAIIWNLSMGEYELDLNKGTTNGYGLLLQKKAPQVVTGVEEVQSDKVQCTKVVIDDHVYILRGGQMYDVTGKMVK